MKELIDAMNDDFKGHEDILNLVKNKTPNTATMMIMQMTSW